MIITLNTKGTTGTNQYTTFNPEATYASTVDVVVMRVVVADVFKRAKGFPYPFLVKASLLSERYLTYQEKQ